MIVTQVVFRETIRVFGQHVSALGDGIATDRSAVALSIQGAFVKLVSPKHARPRLVPLSLVQSLEVDEQATAVKVMKVDKVAKAVTAESAPVENFEVGESIPLDMEDDGDGEIIPEREVPVVVDDAPKKKPGRPRKGVNG